MIGNQKHIMKLGMVEFRFHNRVPYQTWGGQMEKSGYASLVCRFGSIFGMPLAHTIQVHHKLRDPTHLGYALVTLATLLFCRNGFFFGSFCTTFPGVY